MASKKNLSLDDFGLGDDFSDATMDFSVRESSSKKRSPILGMGKVMAKGAVSGLTDASFIRQSIKKTLPEGYGSAFDFADESAATFKSLYNTSATAMRPLTNDLKRTTQRLMPSAGQIIPEKMRRTLDTWSKDIEGQSKYNPEDAINAQIAQSQNEVFQYEFKQRQSDRAEKAAKEEIKEGIEQSRFQTSAKMLNMISLSTQKLADYQEKVTINYQRKMLELQYRQVYILRDTHEEQKRMGAVITEGLKSLIHNTGLPDYEKLTEKNRAGGFMRNQFSSFMGQGLSSARTAFMGKLRGAAEARIKSKVGDFANSAQNALMMANVMLDAKEQMDGMKESMGDMGEDDFGVKGVAAGMGSGWLAQKGAGKGLDWLKKYLAKNPNVLKRGNQAQSFIQNLPQHAHRFANSSMGEGRNPLLDILLGFGKDTINDALKDGPTDLHRSDYSNLQGASVYTNQANKSLTEIIPGYLARILREITVFRTGDNSTPTMVYDYKKNRFDTQRNSEKSALEGAFSTYGMRDIKDRTESIAKQIEDPENPFTREEKRALADQLLRLHRRKGGIADAATLTSTGSYTGSAEAHAERLSGAFGRYYAGDTNHAKEVHMTRQVNALSTGIEERKAVIQDLANAGHLEMLQRAGIVDAKGENIDMDRFYALHLEDDPVLAAVGEQLGSVAPSQGGRRRRLTGFRMGEGNRRPRARASLRGVGKVTPTTPSAVSMPAPAGGYEFQGPPHPPIGSAKVQTTLNWDDAEAPITKATDRLHDDLKRIEALIQAGTKITVARMKFSGIPTPDLDKLGEHIDGMAESGKAHLNKAKGFFDRTLREHLRSAKDTIQNRGQQGYDFVKENAPKARDFVADKYDALRERGRQGWGKFKDTKNVYLPGERMPRLLTAKLKAGEYIDDASGKVIESYKDIRGAIRDKLTDEIVLTDEEAKTAFVRFGPVQKLITAMGAVIKPIKSAAERAMDRVQGAALNAAALARANIKKLKDYLDGPQDVYVAGSSEPVMLARIMRAGGYRLKMDPTKIISKITEINGPVLDVEGNEVLTMADLNSGIYDKMGRPLQTGWLRGGQIVKDFISKHLNTAKDKLTQGLKKAKDAGMHVGGKAVDATKRGWEAFSKWIGSDGVMISGGKTIVDRLTEIRDLLHERMPGGSGSSAASKYKRGNIHHGSRGTGTRAGSVQDILAKRAEERQAAKEEAHHKKEESELDDIDKELGSKGPIAAAMAKMSKKLGGDSGGGIMDMLSDIPGVGGLLKKIPGIGKLGGLLGKIPGLGKLGGLLGGGGLATEAVEGAAAAGGGGLLKGALKGALGAGGAVLRGAGKLGGLSRAATSAAAEAATGPGARGLVGGAAKLAGRGLLKAPGMALTAGKWLLNARNLAGIPGFLLGGAGDAFGGMLMSGLGMAGSGLLAALASPVVLGAAAVAITGAGLYASYKGISKYYGNHKKLDPITAMRFAQYGFLPDDSTHREAVFQLEDLLTPNVHYDSKGMAALNLKKIVPSNLFKLFGIDPKETDQVKNFATWFVKRFKPVYLTHLTILHRLTGSKTLAGTEKLKGSQKTDYINGAKYPDGPYNETVSPFPDLKSLPAGPKDVANAADAALASAKGDGKSKDVMRATDGKGLRPAQKVGGETANQKLDSKGKMLVAAAITGHGTSPTAKAVAAAGGMVMGGTVAGSGLDPKKGVDALTAVRMKTYGLNSMEPEKVQVLLQMEEAVEKRLSVKAATGAKPQDSQKVMQAAYLGDDMAVLHEVGSRFNVIGEAGEAAFNWRKWFGARFLPTYLAYRGALATQSGQTKKAEGERVLMGAPAKAVMVAQAAIGAQSQSKYGGGSVWKQTTSPWPNYDLNTDSSSTKENVTALNQRTGRETLPEAKGKVVAKAATAKGANEAKGKTGPSTWDSVKKWGSDTWNSAKKLASDTWNDAKNAYGTAKTQLASAGAAAGAAVSSAASNAWTGAKNLASKATDAVSSAGKYVAQKVTASASAIKSGLLKALQIAGITNPVEMAMFMAQMDTESGGFKSLSENLNYSPSRLYQVFPKYFKSAEDAAQVAQGGAEAIANRIYGGRMGNTAPGDGFKYRGRGVIQLTGKSNYALYGKKIGVDLVNNPDAASDPMTAAKIAIAYWKDRVSPQAAQSGNVTAVTKSINGGLNGLGDRQSKFQSYLQQAKSGQLTAAATGAAAGGSGLTAGAATPGVNGSDFSGKEVADASANIKKNGSQILDPKQQAAVNQSAATAAASAGGGMGGTAPVAGAAPSSAMAQARAVATAAPAAKSSSGTDSPSAFGGSAPTAAGVPVVTNPTASAVPSSTPVAKDTLTQDMSNIHTQSLKSLQSIESILTDIKTLIAKNGSAATGGGSSGVAGTVASAAQQATQMTRGPISMAKTTFGVT
jgi:predicted chitinase